MALGTNNFSGMKIADIAAHLDHFPDELMADNHGNGDGFLGPCVPFVNMEVGAADASFVDFDEDIVDAGGRFGDVLQPEAAFSVGFD